MGQQLRKAQVSMEFVFLVGLAFMIMIVFVSMSRSEFDSLRKEEERTRVNDLAVLIQHEIILASGMDDGYIRFFETPATLEGTEYTLQISGNTLLVYTEDYESAINIPSVSGSITKGSNKINRTNSIIYLN